MFCRPYGPRPGAVTLGKTLLLLVMRAISGNYTSGSARVKSVLAHWEWPRPLALAKESTATMAAQAKQRSGPGSDRKRPGAFADRLSSDS